ncbi:MAG: GMC family oxidoreductase [Bacteroidales bacterium]
MEPAYDYVVIGSGFGGSVSAHRLTEKGYRVLVLEKGKRWDPSRFPKTNWQLRKWLWLPLFRFHGFFKLTLLPHVSVLSGVGVGGGSLVYANTLPRPAKPFYERGNWAGLADWEKELAPHYEEGERMLGATENPRLFDSDLTLRSVARGLGREESFEPTRVAVFFGEPEKEVPDPYFQGQGPARTGCTHCGACMTGCRFGAKNTLDKNYLYLAERGGAEVRAGQKVRSIRPLDGKHGSTGYEIDVISSTKLFRKRSKVRCRGIVLAGGVLGTVRLLLDMKSTQLPGLSDRVGDHIRTNNESLLLVHSRQKEKEFSKGVAIGSLFAPDEDSHIEPVRYGKGSGFWKLLAVPMGKGGNLANRLAQIGGHLLRRPGSWLRIFVSRDFANSSVILLYMQHLDSTLRLHRGAVNLRTRLARGDRPTAFMPGATRLARETANEVDGQAFVMATEAITARPTTAHILGGCVMGEDARTGVIDRDHRVFGYENFLICDGSAVSANPGVNPALTITALTERAMAKVPRKK